MSTLLTESCCLLATYFSSNASLTSSCIIDGWPVSCKMEGVTRICSKLLRPYLKFNEIFFYVFDNPLLLNVNVASTTSFILINQSIPES